jgi:hypothetical protein
VRFDIGHDLDLKLRAGPIALSNLSAASIDAALRVKDDRLDVDKLSVSDIAGASVSATGSVRDLAGDPIGDIDATILADDLRPLVDQLATTFPTNRFVRELADRAAGFPLLLTDARLDVVGSLAMAAWPAADLALSAGQGRRLRFSATLSGDYNDGISLDAHSRRRSRRPIPMRRRFLRSRACRPAVGRGRARTTQRHVQRYVG